MSPPGPLRWFKAYGHQLIHGTTTKELEPGERWCWIGFLSLASLSPVPGTICVSEGLPHTTHQLCHLLNVPPTLLKRATEKMVAAGKVSVNGDGIHITKWEHYQGDYVRKQQERARVANVTPPPGVSNVTDRGRGRGEERGGEEEISSSSSADAHLAQIVTLYEQNIGAITPMVADELKDIADTDPPGWFEAALKEALDNNARSLRYITVVLVRWRRDGFKAPRPGSRTHRPGRRPGQQLPGAQQLKEGWGADEEP